MTWTSRFDRFIDGWVRRLDRMISPEILARGEPHGARARLLIVQAGGIFLISVSAMTYQALHGTRSLALSGIGVCALTLAIPFILRRAKSNVWVGGLLTASLFATLTSVNILSAGQTVATVVFLVTIPLVGTLSQGVGWGAFWAAAVGVELALLSWGVTHGWTPTVQPNPMAHETGYLRGAAYSAVMIFVMGTLHGLLSEYSLRRATASEKRLARNQALYRGMLDAAPDGLFTVSSGQLEFVNRTLCDLLGYPTADSLRGRPLSGILESPDLASLRPAEGESEVVTAVEGRIRHAEGSLLDVEIATTPMYVDDSRDQVFRVRDIRPLIRANQEIRSIRASIEQAPFGMAVLDLDSTVEYANDAFLEMTSFPRESLIGRKLLDLNRSDSGHEALLSIQAAVQRGEVVSIPKMNWTRFGGRPGHMDVRAFAATPQGGGKPRWVTFVRDVTHFVELENEARRAERIDSLGKLAGGIAHDFNNLLTVIMGQVELLSEDLLEDHWGRSHLDTIMVACERSAALTSKILAFGRKQTLRPEVFKTDEAIREMFPILRQLATERVSLEVSIESGAVPLAIRCDPSHFEQILLNLVSNARDAIDDDGTISVHVGVADRSEATDAIDEIEIRVGDDGKGMSAEVADRIFEPFYTTKPMGEGTGLGLSTVHGIVHQSGGRLEFETAEGVGTTIRVYFPMVGANETAADEASRAPESLHEVQRGIVLVVEDHPAVRTLIQRAVERLGYGVVATQNGDEALDWIENRGQPFDALISDVVLPGASGVEVARVFRARFVDKKIVLMSGYAKEDVGRLGELPNDVRFVSKPVTSKSLADALFHPGGRNVRDMA